MLAGVRQIAYGLAMVMAGFLVVALANSICTVLFRADALILFGIEKPDWAFGGTLSWWASPYGFSDYEAFFGLGVVMWLTGHALRRILRSKAARRAARQFRPQKVR